MTIKMIPDVLGLVILLAVLTFIVPGTQWLVDRLIAPSQYGGLIRSVSVILCVCLWYGRTRAFSLFPSSSFWKMLCLCAGVIILVLLVINTLNQPPSKITGRARSPFEVADTIVFLPLAEELIFRGVMWSICERLSRNGRWNVVALAGTSLLFGVGHLGYWAQSHWPLPPEAVIHSLSMVAAGVCFGMLRHASKSLAAPAAVHMLANGVILLTQ